MTGANTFDCTLTSLCMNSLRDITKEDAHRMMQNVGRRNMLTLYPTRKQDLLTLE